jgi:hypothetical protein
MSTKLLVRIAAALALALAAALPTLAIAQHPEVEGYVIRDEGGVVLIHEWQGTMLADLEIEVHHEEATESLFVELLGVDSTRINEELPPAEVWLVFEVDNEGIASVDSLDQFVFRLNGLVEGMTLGRVRVFHEDHFDFTGQDIEIHVAEGHAEADGMIIRKAGTVIVHLWQGTLTGSIQVLGGASTDSLHVTFLDVDSLEFSPEAPHFVMSLENDTPSIATFDSLAEWTFRANGLQLGTGTMRVCIFHETHCDFTSVNVPVEVLTATGVRTPPVALGLRAYPNPFASAARLEFTLSSEQTVRIEVYDVAGRRVRTVLEGRRPAGVHAFTLDGRGLASGVYFVKASTPSASRVQKVILAR